MTFEDLGIEPPWTKDMTSEQLDVQERKAFIDWRRGIAELEEKHEDAFVTPLKRTCSFGVNYGGQWKGAILFADVDAKRRSCFFDVRILSAMHQK